MNNSIIRYCILSLLAVAPSFVVAQEKVVTQSVNVEKDFIPEVKKASKILFRPQQEPPAIIDFSNMNYNILYRSEPYSPVVNPLSMPTYERSSYKKLYNGYASVMIGAPIQSRANLFYTTAAKRDLILGFGLNHSGYYGKLKNDYGDRISAFDTNNDLSFMLKYRVNNLEINFDAMLNYHAFNRYGYANIEGYIRNSDDYEYVQRNLKQSFSRAIANISIGTPENNQSLFNGRFKGFYSAIQDKYTYSEQITHAGLSASTRKLNNIHRFFLDMEYIIVFAEDNMKQVAPVVSTPEGFDISENIQGSDILPYSTLFVYPKYTLNYKKFDFELGAKMTFCVGNEWYNDKKPAINPVAKVQFRFLDNALIPYISLDGEYQYNTYYNISAINPYVTEGLTAPNTNVNTLVVGIKGNVKSKLQYDAFFGLEKTHNKVMFINNVYGNTFTTAVANMNAFIAGASLRYDITRNIYFHGMWRYDNYDNEDTKELGTKDDLAYGIPAHKASLKVGYEHNNSKFGAYLKANIQSKRDCAAIYRYDVIMLHFNEIGAKADLSLGGFYKVGKRVELNLELNNILGSKLYEYNFYRGIGFNALVGASFVF